MPGSGGQVLTRFLLRYAYSVRLLRPRRATRPSGLTPHPQYSSAFMLSALIPTALLSWLGLSLETAFAILGVVAVLGAISALWMQPMTPYGNGNTVAVIGLRARPAAPLAGRKPITSRDVSPSVSDGASRDVSPSPDAAGDEAVAASSAAVAEDSWHTLLSARMLFMAFAFGCFMLVFAYVIGTLPLQLQKRYGDDSPEVERLVNTFNVLFSVGVLVAFASGCVPYATLRLCMLLTLSLSLSPLSGR